MCSRHQLVNQLAHDVDFLQQTHNNMTSHRDKHELLQASQLSDGATQIQMEIDVPTAITGEIPLSQRPQNCRSQTVAISVLLEKKNTSWIRGVTQPHDVKRWPINNS